MSGGTLFAAHAISNFLTWTSGSVPGLPWKYGKFTILLILGGLAAILGSGTAGGVTGRKGGDVNCVLSGGGGINCAMGTNGE